MFSLSFSKLLVTQSLVLLKTFQELAWQINYKKLVFPTGRRQTSFLFFKCERGVSLKLTDKSIEGVVQSGTSRSSWTRCKSHYPFTSYSLISIKFLSQPAVVRVGKFNIQFSILVHGFSIRWGFWSASVFRVTNCYRSVFRRQSRLWRDLSKWKCVRALLRPTTHLRCDTVAITFVLS